MKTKRLFALVFVLMLSSAFIASAIQTQNDPDGSRGKPFLIDGEDASNNQKSSKYYQGKEDNSPIVRLNSGESVTGYDSSKGTYTINDKDERPRFIKSESTTYDISYSKSGNENTQISTVRVRPNSGSEMIVRNVPDSTDANDISSIDARTWAAASRNGIDDYSQITNLNDLSDSNTVTIEGRTYGKSNNILYESEAKISNNVIVNPTIYHEDGSYTVYEGNTNENGKPVGVFSGTEYDSSGRVAGHFSTDDGDSVDYTFISYSENGNIESVSVTSYKDYNSRTLNQGDLYTFGSFDGNSLHVGTAEDSEGNTYNLYVDYATGDHILTETDGEGKEIFVERCFGECSGLTVKDTEGNKVENSGEATGRAVDMIDIKTGTYGVGIMSQAWRGFLGHSRFLNLMKEWLVNNPLSGYAGYSSLIKNKAWQDFTKKWRDTVHNLMCSTIPTQIDCAVSRICESGLAGFDPEDLPDDTIYTADPDTGLITAAAHVEAERSYPIYIPDEDGTTATKYLYKVSYFVSFPDNEDSNEDEMTYSIRMKHGNQWHISLRNKKVKEGNTAGETVDPFLSERLYEKIELEISPGIPDWRGGVENLEISNSGLAQKIPETQKITVDVVAPPENVQLSQRERQRTTERAQEALEESSEQHEESGDNWI